MSALPEHQFDDIEQQYDAAYSGMWIFLSTEVLFFGGVFFAYVIYRSTYYDAFAEGSRELSVFLGGSMQQPVHGSRGSCRPARP